MWLSRNKKAIVSILSIRLVFYANPRFGTFQYMTWHVPVHDSSLSPRKFFKYLLQRFTLLSILRLLPNRIRLVTSGPRCTVPGGHCSHGSIAKWCTPKVILYCILGPSHPQIPQGQIVDGMLTFLQIITVILYN